MHFVLTLTIIVHKLLDEHIQRVLEIKHFNYFVEMIK